MKTAVVLLSGAISVSSPALADIAPFLGTHCGANEMIHIEATGGGFNEHTICDYVADPHIKSRSIEVQMACRNVRVLDVSVDPPLIEETDHRDLILRLHRSAADIASFDAFIDGMPIGRFGACG